MADPAVLIGLIVLGYLIGALPMGVLVARLAGGPDPRQLGSGSTGSTNIRRSLGTRWALLVALLDGLKGVVPILLARALGQEVPAQALVGAFAVLGAWRSVFIGFGGGRGVATYFAGLLVIAPVLVLLAVPVFGIGIRQTRRVSAGSLLGTIVVAAGAIVLVAVNLLSPGWLLYVLAGTTVILLAHRDNIGRLLAGDELPFDTGSSS